MGGGGGGNIPGGSPSRGSDVTSKNVWKGGAENNNGQMSIQRTALGPLVGSGG